MTKADLLKMREHVAGLPALTVQFGGPQGVECAPPSVVRYKVLAIIDAAIAAEPPAQDEDRVSRDASMIGRQQGFR